MREKLRPSAPCLFFLSVRPSVPYSPFVRPSLLLRPSVRPFQYLSHPSTRSLILSFEYLFRFTRFSRRSIDGEQIIDVPMRIASQIFRDSSLTAIDYLLLPQMESIIQRIHDFSGTMARLPGGCENEENCVRPSVRPSVRPYLFSFLSVRPRVLSFVLSVCPFLHS